MRVGFGFDAHAFTDDARPLLLAGVAIPGARGLAAHSDGDVVIHALCDALLGAAGLNDIGAHFPDSDPDYRGIAGRMLLERVMIMLGAKKLAPVNADITIIAQTPRIDPHRSAMRANLAALLELSEDRVNVKASTTEGMGYTGRSEGIAVHAVVLLE